ncbi:FecR family protein [Microbulbifer pacificus]|uniref:FecR family protein n=1 Tax=Microbulbifer pacificus TaxID=407164 RepID=A0AAU0N0E4_9GAMM|nr:FecR family protein [Microbulbifer pacificus]WOX05134.1 FecR family protein [Microbulbifer pacificus]
MKMMHSEDSLESLLRKAGKRPSPESDVSNDIMAATKQAWYDAVANHRRARIRRFVTTSAIAASLLVAIVIAFLPTMEGSDIQPMGHIASISGSMHINGKHSGQKVLSVGDYLATDGASRMSLVLNNGVSLIIDEFTELEFTSERVISLNSGRLYFDSGNSNSNMIIKTAIGNIEDIGTQYEVHVRNESLKVAMREGETLVSLADGVKHTTIAGDGSGDVIVIDRDGSVERTTISSSDPYWGWVLDASEDIALEGKNLSEILLLAGRLTGRKVIFNTPEVQRIAETTRLSGGTLDPELIETTLPLIMETTTLSITLKQDRIEIESNNNSNL